MSPADAAKLLDLPADASPDQLEARFNELRRKLEDKIARAPTPGLQAKYRESLAEITTAFETLTLAADSSTLPITQKQGSTGPGVADDARARATPTNPGPSTPAKASHRKSGGKEFVVVALIAVAVLGAGGWWVMKIRAENAEKARVAAEAIAAAEAKAAAEKAEQERKAEEAKLAAEAKRQAEEAEKARLVAAEKAEQERQAKLMAQTSATLVNLRIAWEAAEQEERRAERRLGELRNEERNQANAAKGAAASPGLLRLRAEVAAQSSYHEWIETQLGRHEAKILRAQAEAMISVRQYDQAAQIVARAEAAQAALDREIVSTRAEKLDLSGPLSINVRPAQAEWMLTDAYGAQRTGRGAVEVPEVPWGPATLEVSLAGFLPKRLEGVHRRGQPLALVAEFKPVMLRVDSDPQGAEIRVGGQPAGNTPGTIEWAGDGRVELTLRLRGYDTFSEVLELSSGDDIDRGTVPLSPIPKGLTRPDFSKGPLRYVVTSQNTHNFHNTDNSRVTDDFVSNTYSSSEQRCEIESPTGLAADATRVTITTISSTSNGQNVLHPGTVQEFTRTESGWQRAFKRGGAVDPNVGAYLKDGPVEQSPVAGRSLLDNPEWWPTEPKQVGETWSVPIAMIKASGLATMLDKNLSGSVTGRVVRLQLDDTRQVAEIEYTFQVSSSDTVSDIKMAYNSSGRITCTVDLKHRYISALSYSVNGNDTTDSHIMMGMRLKGVTTTTATATVVTKPL